MPSYVRVICDICHETVAETKISETTSPQAALRLARTSFKFEDGKYICHNCQDSVTITLQTEFGERDIEVPVLFLYANGNIAVHPMYGGMALDLRRTITHVPTGYALATVATINDALNLAAALAALDVEWRRDRIGKFTKEERRAILEVVKPVDISREQERPTTYE
jgi:hypothetical protein